MLKSIVYFTILIGMTKCASVLQTSFKLHEKMTQTDNSIHTIVDLVTTEKTSECANYCMMQGNSFRYSYSKLNY